jgi:transcriptional regulator GlxA family with amidase domain
MSETLTVAATRASGNRGVAARVRRAQHRLEATALSVEQVATEAGFGSATVLREHFGRIVGVSPLARGAGRPP